MGEKLNIEALEVFCVTSNDGEFVNAGGSSNHGVFKEGAIAPVNQLGPLAGDGRIQFDNLPDASDPVNPLVDFCCLLLVLLARDLRTGLQLAQDDGRNSNVIRRNRLQPRYYRTVGAILS